MKRTLSMLLAALVTLSAAAADNWSDSSAAQTEKKAKKTKEVRNVTFLVDIDCANCVRKVQENISFEKGVKGLDVTLEDRTVAIKYDPAKTSEDVLKAAIEKLGYPVLGVVEPGHEHDHHHGEAGHHDHSGHRY